jgi:ferrochelatase
MLDNILPISHPKIPNKIGTLLLNLGTPDNYDYFAVRRYLKEFLSDKKVIEVNYILWQIILNLFILTFRPRATGEKYKKIWFHDKNESPLRYYTKQQALKFQQLIDTKHNDVIVEYAMRYGNPSIESGIESLLKQGCNKIIFIPLYPQYCAATTATVNDEIYRIIKKIRWQPNIRIVAPYHDNEVYINSLVSTVIKHKQDLSWQPDAILSSYHGIPQDYFDKGDPYSCFCHKTNRLFSEELKKEGINIPNHISFQSRFGPRKWIKPYTEDVIKDLLGKGVKNLLVITPGFASDCIETLEEVDIEYRNLFITNGGKNFSLVPCLNDSDESLELINNLFDKNLWM